MRISIDAMGGDHGLSVTLPAVCQALHKHLDLHLVLVGDELPIKQGLEALRFNDWGRITIHHTTQLVAMDESPAVALRTKKDSSMRVAIDLVKEKQVQACVSAGNTGALMATARYVLKTLPGVDRPAILAVLPTVNENGVVRMLDLGANVDASADQLFQFAVMGAVVAAYVDKRPHARVGLLNIGVEAIKGTGPVRETAEKLLACQAINYIGYVEGDAIYEGGVDVVVCDGFVGNVALKASEGLAYLISRYLYNAFRKNMLTRFVGLLAQPILRSFKKSVDPARYNGASFVGLQGIVIKSHGGADVKAYGHAIDEAVMEVQHDIPRRIRDEVAALLTSSQP